MVERSDEMIKYCPICEQGEAFPFFFVENIPVLNNILCRSPEAARNITVGTLDFYACEQCGFVWNAAFDGSIVQYDANYENNQSVSSVFEKHLEEVVLKIRDLMFSSPFSVIEVGCGQGYFLDLLEARLEDAWVRGIGFDPALRAFKSTETLRLIPQFASSSLIPKDLSSPLLLLSRHVIEHIAAPLPFMRSLLNISPHISAVMLETPSVEWIIDNGAYFDFYYEHCSIFTVRSLSILLRKLGLGNLTISSLFGGQYLLGGGIVGAKADEEKGNIDFKDLFKTFADDYKRFVERWKIYLRGLVREGKRVALWGGGSKGVMFMNMLGKEAGVYAAIDINSKKQGSFLPLSALPVISIGDAKKAKVDVAIVMNPNYTKEINELCVQAEFFPTLISIENDL